MIIKIIITVTISHEKCFLFELVNNEMGLESRSSVPVSGICMKKCHGNV